MEFEPEEGDTQEEAGEPVLASSAKEETLRSQLGEPWATGQSLVVCHTPADWTTFKCSSQLKILCNSAHC